MAKINFENCWIRQKEEEERLNAVDSKLSNNDSQDEEETQEQNRKTQGQFRPHGKAYTKNVFSINTAFARLELETIQEVIAKMGYMETTVNGSLYWFGLALVEKDYKIYFKKKCFYNRYPLMEYLARKKVFSAITNRMRRTFPKLFNFAPISFLIPEASDALETYMAAHPNFFWIGKPSCGRGGEGIMLL